ncbi:hypothetical protein ThidrDRAFT_1163 [Thiorhodococcus drewsii AZ1]|uniref:Uncharacterized protein n=1 Tax=Thiorhodococcus drewsii AZ1 TaxID=765913 RepID=G2DYQ1_9GAMM|nr:hypothetical protein ThidrDRAFT_1163 [Thiorhodococcus drewsii AZ1]
MSANLALVVDQSGATLEKGTHDTLVLVHADGRRERVRSAAPACRPAP